MREVAQEIRTLQLQKAVALGAARDVQNAQRKDALEHYIGMLDYVLSMLQLKRTLTLRGLFKRGIASVIPGYGYKPKHRLAAMRIQRHWRGVVNLSQLVRALFRRGVIQQRQRLLIGHPKRLLHKLSQGLR